MPHLQTRSIAYFLRAQRKKMSPPEVIDEIGSASEVEAACSIGFRGIVLVATAHACSLQEAMNNPTLQPLYLAIKLRGFLVVHWVWITSWSSSSSSSSTSSSSTSPLTSSLTMNDKSRFSVIEPMFTWWSLIHWYYFGMRAATDETCKAVLVR